MAAEGETPLHLSDELFSSIRSAINTHEVDAVDFASVGANLPRSMTPFDIQAINAQFLARILEERPLWGGSVNRLNMRVAFTIGHAACETKDLMTAKSAEKTMWKQGPVFGWIGAFLVRRNIKKYIV